MEGQLVCPICKRNYESNNCPRLLTMCGHSFCENCIKSLISKKTDGKYKIVCPEDLSFIDLQSSKITQFPKNIALINAANSGRIRSKASLFGRSSLNSISGIQEVEQLQQQGDSSCNEFLEIMRRNSKGSIQTPIKRATVSLGLTKSHHDSVYKQENQICFDHQKPLQIVCIQHAERICVNCALFGQHKGHTFKKVDQIQNESMNLRELFKKLMAELKVKEDKQTQQKERENSSMQLLFDRREKLRKQVSQYCEVLTQIIKLVQQQSYLKIDQMILETEEKIKLNLQKLPNVSAFSQWQQQVDRIFQIIQKGSFEQKVNEFFKGKINIQTLLSQGRSFIEKINSNSSNSIEKVLNLIESIKIQKNSKIQKELTNLFSFVNRSIRSSMSNSSMLKQAIESASPSEKRIFFTEFEVSQSCDEQEQSLLDERPLRMSKSIKSPQFNNANFKTQLQCMPMKRSVCNLQLNKSVGDLKRKRNTSFLPKSEHGNKRILKFKLSQKCQKALNGLKCNTIDILDLTGEELGDQWVSNLLQNLKQADKLKTIKLIRNKLSDDYFEKLLCNIPNITNLNLSQNSLTEKTLQLLVQNIQNLPNLKSIVLSQNKIVERRNRQKVEYLRLSGLIVTL